MRNNFSQRCLLEKKVKIFKGIELFTWHLHLLFKKVIKTKHFQHQVIIALMMTKCQKCLVFTYLICQLILNLSKLYGQHSWISFSLKMIRNEFFYSPSTLSILRFTHMLPSFSSRSVVERRGGDEEPESKGIQSFSKFSVLLYTEKITTGTPVQNSKLQSC